MIHVLAAIEVAPEKRDEFLRIFKENVPNVLGEDGCRGYAPAIDIDSGIPIQTRLPQNVIVVVEQWESVDHLKAHLAAPHMAKYRENVRDFVKSVALQVLTDA